MSGLRLAFLGDPRSVHLQRWLAAFVSRGHDVHLLIPGELSDEPAPDGVRTWTFRSLPDRLHAGELLATRRDLRAILRELGPHLVHAHYARRPAWHAWLAGAHPYLVTVWGSDVLRTERMTLSGRLATRLALRAARLVTAASEHLAAAAVRLGARRERVRLVQFGVDTSLFAPGLSPAGLRERLGLPDGPIVLSPRTLTPLYRHETVVRAVSQLPADTQLVTLAAHADPAYRADLAAQAAHLGIADRLHILEPMTPVQMADLYRLADVVVSVPESDGVPVTVLEGLASARPLIATDLPGVREWLAGPGADRLVPVGDADALVAALRRVLFGDRTQSAQVADALRSRVVERADANRSMDAVEVLYRELAGERRR